MALRICSRRAAHISRRTRPRFTLNQRATYATPAQASNLPQADQQAIHRDASLLTPDPAKDSQTSTLVNDQMPYMVPTYVRPPPMFAKGEGCNLWDVENRQYLDFTAGIAVNALGHCDPALAQIISNQVQTLIHTSNLYHNPWTGLLSQTLVDATKASGAMRNAARAFICNSGSEANEAAIKFGRKAGSILDPSGKKIRVVSFTSAFHGRTMGALSATPNPKYQKPFAPMVPGFVVGTFNDVSAVDSLVTDETCAVLVEPIQGEGGVNVATPEFLRALRNACDRTGALLVFDEIQCGLSRTGTLWAHAGIGEPGPSQPHPDVLTTAKALGNGFPIGATMVSEAVSSKIVTGDHGTTFGGNPLGARIAHHIIGRLAATEMQDGVRAKESLLRRHVAQLQSRFGHERIIEVRGKGLLLGVQLGSDPTPIVTAARERGLLVITCGTNTLRLVPPLIVTEEEIGRAMHTLEAAMASVWEHGEVNESTKGQQEMAPPGR